MLATFPAPGARAPGLRPAEAWLPQGADGGQRVGRGGLHRSEGESRQLRPGPWGGQWGCRARGPGSSLFPVLFLSLALCPGQQPTCLQGSPPRPPACRLPPSQPPCEAHVGGGGRGPPGWANGSPKGVRGVDWPSNEGSRAGGGPQGRGRDMRTPSKSPLGVCFGVFGR